MKKVFYCLLPIWISGLILSASAEKGYGFQIVDVSYPQVVKPNEAFQIDVKIHYWIGPYYRDKIQLQVRIVDQDSEVTILIQNFPYDEYNVSGEDVYTFILAAPSYGTTWNLSVRAYLVASHYDLTHAETDWYKDIEVRVSYATTASSTSTSEKGVETIEILTVTVTESTTMIQTSVIPQYAIQDQGILAGVAIMGLILVIFLIARRKKPQ